MLEEIGTWFQGKVANFRQRWNDAVLLTSWQRATRLEAEGHQDEALEVLESGAGFTGIDYGDESLLREAIAHRLAPPGSLLDVDYLAKLLLLLSAAGRHSDAFKLFAAAFGIEPQLISSPARVSQALDRGWIDHPEHLMAARLVLSTLLGQDGNFAAGWQVLAGGREDLPFESLASLQQELEKLLIGPAELHLPYLAALSHFLAMAGRQSDSLAVLACVSTPDEARLDDVAPLTEPQIVTLLGLLGAVMSEGEKGKEALGRIEAILGFEQQDYADPGQLGLKWRQRMALVPTEPIAAVTVGIASALTFHGRPRDAISLIEADCGIRNEDDRASPIYLKKINARLEDLSAMGRSTYLRGLTHSLDNSGDHGSAFVLLDLELAPDETTSLLADRIRGQISELGFFTASAHVNELVRLLRAKNRFEHVRLCLDIGFTEILEPLRKQGGPFNLVVGQLWEYWLQEFGRDPEKESLTVCREILQDLRANAAGMGSSLKDREILWHRLDDLRRAILETGFYWARKGPETSSGADSWLEVQLWDLELSQRVLLERFLLQKIAVPVLPQGLLPQPGWPFFSQSEPRGRTHLPKPGIPSLLGVLGVHDRTKSELEDATAPGSANLRGNDLDPAVVERIRELAAAGIDPSELAAALGEDCLFLRIACGPDGQILWMALESDGKELHSSAHGGGMSGDRELLRWATTRHDLRLQLLRSGLEMDSGRDLVLKVVAKVLAELEQRLSRGREEIAAGSGLRLVTWLFESLKLIPQEEQVDLLEILELLFLIWNPPTGSALQQWATVALTELPKIRLLLRAQGPDPSTEGLRTALDAATSQFAAEVAAIVDLDKLAAVLSPGKHLVCQLDDALSGAPVAHMPVGRKPLFQQVASVRSHFGLLSLALGPGEIPREPPKLRRLLALSHCQRDDPAVQGARWFHMGLGKIAKSFSIESFHAAEQPIGELSVLQSAIVEFSDFDVVALFGHGDESRHGVVLGNPAAGPLGEAVWGGQGCDLSGVDWLWMVSCSLGRLRETHDRDVDGFCIELALHRANSIAAYRWPVDALEAASFATESIRRYLELKSQVQSGSGHAALRARALNDTRKAFLGDGEKPPRLCQASLATIGACELFGLG